MLRFLSIIDYTSEIQFRNYYLKQFNTTSQQLILNSIYSYMSNETKILGDAAYYEGPSVVGYLMMTYGTETHSLNLLYFSTPFIRFVMNTEQLTWQT